MERRKRKAARIPISEIEELLFSNGLTIQDYFISGSMVMFWDQGNRAFAMLIDEDALAAACESYLIDHGVPQYRSATDIPGIRPA